MMHLLQARLRTAFLVILLFTLVYHTHAQVSENKPGKRNRSFVLFSDSASATQAEYMLYLESVYQKLDSIQNESVLNQEVAINGMQLKECDSIIRFVDQSLAKYNQTLHIKNLEMLKILLTSVQTDLHKYNKNFKEEYNGFSKLKAEIRGMRKDSILQQLLKDSVARQSFMPQLQDLRQKRRTTDSLLTSRLTTINLYKTQASKASISSAQLMNKLNKQLNSAGKKIFSKEYHYFWESPVTDAGTNELIAGVFMEEQKALNYYYSNSTENRFFRWIIGIAFLFWIMRNERILKKRNKLETLNQYNIMDIARQPFASAFAVIFSIAPLFDMHAPSAYVQLIQFMSIIALTFLFVKQWPRQLFYYWVGIVILFFLFTFTSHILMPNLWQRCLILAINAAAALLALAFRRKLPADLQLRRFISIVMVIQFILHVLSILFNVYGRMTLAQMLSTAALFATLQAISLSMLVKILIEAILLQIHTSRVKIGLEQPFHVTPLVEDFKKPMLWIVSLIWATVFTTHLNIYDSIFEGLGNLLEKQHNIGSISFTLGNIALFFLFIWLAHFLQRYISYFLGDTGDDESEGLAHRSKLVMTRLVVLALGYLLAVAASGIPVDKITIVLGALGVGIGLGLQNIVNNFVSGIILIFDRPLRVGDSVEIGGSNGRVKEIGLRSSTLITVEGADVIIPNGDMLSQRITNWTHGNPYKRVDLTLTIDTNENKDTIIALIKEIVRSADHVLKKREPVVLLENIQGGQYLLKVFFWCEDFYKAELTKGEVRYAIYQEFKDKGINAKW